MATLITDPELEERIRAQRAEWGGDRYDEAWEGTYMMAPIPNPEHGEIQAGLMTVFRLALGLSHPAKIYTVNVSDRVDDWTKNYRCPDVSVILPGGIARQRESHVVGGPDFVVEIISPYDRSREKIAFYTQIGVRELLLVDRKPWSLELHRLRDGRLELEGQSRLPQSELFESTVLPLAFRLIPGGSRPGIEMRHTHGEQKWVV